MRVLRAVTAAAVWLHVCAAGDHLAALREREAEFLAQVEVGAQRQQNDGSKGSLEVIFRVQGPLGIQFKEDLTIMAFREVGDGRLGAAEKSGLLHVGDKLLAVNGDDVSALTTSDAFQVLDEAAEQSARAGTPRRFLFQLGNGGPARRVLSEEGHLAARPDAVAEHIDVLDASGVEHTMRVMMAAPGLGGPAKGCDYFPLVFVEPQDACNEDLVTTLPKRIVGAFAVVQRGGCSFQRKVKTMELLGASAVLVINSEDRLFRMEPDAFALEDLSLPVAMISAPDGNALRKLQSHRLMDLDLRIRAKLVASQDCAAIERENLALAAAKARGDKSFFRTQGALRETDLSEAGHHRFGALAPAGTFVLDNGSDRVFDFITAAYSAPLPVGRDLAATNMSGENGNGGSKRAKTHRSMEAAWSYLLYLEEDNAQNQQNGGKDDGKDVKLEITANGITQKNSDPTLEDKANGTGSGAAEADGDSKPETDEIPVDHQLLHLNDGAKLIVCMVGKPARGKTFLAAKLQRYLEWLDYRVKHIDTVAVRRKLYSKVDPDDFFNPETENTKAQRRAAHEESLKQAVEWLQSGGQAVIYDATNGTRERRKWISDYIEKNLVDKTSNETVMSHRILWVESVCDNDEFIVQNFLELRKKNADFCEFKDLDDAAASAKFLKKLEYYDAEYETLDATIEDISFIRLLDFGQSVLVNKIHGFIESKLVSFCMNIHMEPRVIILLRHGQSEFNVEDRIGGDPDLTDHGKLFAKNLAKFIDAEAPHGLQPREAELLDEAEEAEAAAVAAAAAAAAAATTSSSSSSSSAAATPAASADANGNEHDEDMRDAASEEVAQPTNPYGFDPAKDLFVWTSILQRTLQTVRHIKCRSTVSWVSLSEIDAGVCECMTYKEFREQLATQFMKRQRNKATWRYPGGESYLDVKKRLEPVIFELERQRKPVLVCAHRAVIRCLYSYFCGIPITKAPFLPVPLHTALVLTPTSHGWTETRTPIEPSVGDLGAHELKNKDHDVHAAAAKIRKSQAKKRRLELQARQDASEAARAARQKLNADEQGTAATNGSSTGAKTKFAGNDTGIGSEKMKLKQLESALSHVEPFREPRWDLEQYPTSAHIAARILYTADASFDDIEDKTVLDLGCGTCMLGIAAQILGSAYTLGVDLDPNALAVAVDNIEEMEVDIDLINANVLDGSLPLPAASFDTVVMNPPFGTRNKGADVAFIETALRLSRKAVYSLHKSSTRDFLQRKANKDWEVSFEVIAQLRFDIPKMYKFHKKQSADVMVDLIRLCKPDPKPDSEPKAPAPAVGATAATATTGSLPSQAPEPAPPTPTPSATSERVASLSNEIDALALDQSQNDASDVAK
ncbi:6-phosphofructo-2-kinase/fructose-2,6-bisphosphatase 2 [Hondaea fermentalgiana]|uniref:6-phosphofructo-2-kinase/fructose-2,6-bisphosphatase 2 n=1 Tax=Hondaea fermentalgiana TaxID=2315210 RepID=A0A2R5GJM9_9STRA|nr:6-phosphofructo-2-kinase/fructose-2,6-bisphosphatase 2 [Hondaea fermentalgiana]|eukprot:GBG28064.1 6-phosphofructo-2-kinase/fructose-2,6-bisphosphatase 2 [Hondaea fermentalgiana]